MIRIVQADCREALKGMQAEGVDLIIWDPPFNLGKKYDGYDDNATADDHDTLLTTVAAELLRLLKVGGSAYVFCSTQMLWPLRPLVERVGWTFQDLLIWYGPNGFSNRAKTRWAPLFEPIFHLAKGSADTMVRVAEGKLVGAWYHAVLTIPRPQSNFAGDQHRVHPTQKPVKLYGNLLRQHYPGVVLDPMAGSCTTALAAKALGWDCICIEQSKKYCELGRKRLAEFDGGLFDRPRTADAGLFAEVTE